MREAKEINTFLSLSTLQYQPPFFPPLDRPFPPFFPPLALLPSKPPSSASTLPCTCPSTGFFFSPLHPLAPRTGASSSPILPSAKKVINLFFGMDSQREHMSFTDMLRQHDSSVTINLEDRFMSVSESIPENPQVFKPPKQSIRGAAFSSAEDRLLISAWLNISHDPITGNEQRLGSYWKRITAYYNAHKSTNVDRTQTSLANRWGTIQKAVTKFCGCYAQVNDLHRSGVNETDKIEQAKILYKDDTNTSFTLENHWNILKGQPKWVHSLEMLRQKGKKTPDSRHSTPDSRHSTPDSRHSTPESVNLEDGVSQSSFSNVEERPPGRKAEKARVLKRKGMAEEAGKVQALLADMKKDKLRMHAEGMEEIRIDRAVKTDQIAQRELERLDKKRIDDERILPTDTSVILHMQAS